MEITATTAGASGIAIHLGSSSILPTTCFARNVRKSTDERDQEERESQIEVAERSEAPRSGLTPDHLRSGDRQPRSLSGNAGAPNTGTPEPFDAAIVRHLVKQSVHVAEATQFVPGQAARWKARTAGRLR
jgi:hypothetical protein